MRLINTDTLEMQFFMSASDAPPYAILSHTWDAEEVSFQDYNNPNKELREGMKGYQKIVKTCELARRDGLQHVWVDTCCIDKNSSAELTEAINSMYRWYKDSAVCYAWLADLPSGATVSLVGEHGVLKRCRWFTRGWTLQELIAPPELRFYDAGWEFRGTRIDLCDVISEITNISRQVLQDPTTLDTLAVAERMSWAANRKTTREEDVAYCLLGIFNVNMPMMYGEGKRAFIRLQEEIANESNDLSLFAWRARSAGQRHRGIFALSPDEFFRAGGTKLIGTAVYNPEFTITNKGVKIDSDIYLGPDRMYIIMLNCTQVVNGADVPVGICLRGHGGTVYSRIRAHELGSVAKRNTARTTTLYILRTISPSMSNTLDRSHSGGFVFRKNFNPRDKVLYPDFFFRVLKLFPEPAWDAQRSMFITGGGQEEFCGYVLFSAHGNPSFPKDKLSDGGGFMVVFGKGDKEEDQPWITLGSASDNAALYTVINETSRLAEVAKQNLVQSLPLRTKRLQLGPKVSVKMTQEVVDGETVYCIDLDMEREWEQDGVIVSLDKAGATAG